MRWRSAVAFVTVSVLSSCQGGPPPNHWYAADNSYAIYLAWTQDTTGHLQGQVQFVGADPAWPTQFRSINAAFTGTLSGSDVSLAFPLLSEFSGATWTGTLHGDALELVVPTTGVPSNPVLHAGSFSDFQTAAQKIQSGVKVAQQSQAQYEAQVAAQQQLDQQKRNTYNSMVQASDTARNAYANVNKSLAGLLAALPATPGPNGLRARYAKEWDTMQETWSKEQDEAQATPLTCYRKGQVQYIAGQVDYERGQVQYLDGQKEYFLNQVHETISAINSNLSTFQRASQQYYDRARAYEQLTGQSQGVSDPSARLQTFTKQTDDSLILIDGRITGMNDLIKRYDDSAAALTQRAQSFANGLECSS